MTRQVLYKAGLKRERERFGNIGWEIQGQRKSRRNGAMLYLDVNCRGEVGFWVRYAVSKFRKYLQCYSRSELFERSESKIKWTNDL